MVDQSAPEHVLRPARNPGSAEHRLTELTVTQAAPEVGLKFRQDHFGISFAEDAQGNEYFIDENTNVAMPLYDGMKLQAKVTGRGYVLTATKIK